MKARLAIAREGSGGSTRPADLIDSLYERHVGQVKRWARQLAGPGTDLEDLVHDVFLVAFRKGFQQRGEASVDTWLFRITDREVKGVRRRGRLRQFLLGRHQESLVAPPPDTPHQEVERREQHEQLYRALDRLPDRYRTPLILFELEDLSGERVAELIGTSVATVWVRLHRGRERLLQLLAEDDRA